MFYSSGRKDGCRNARIVTLIVHPYGRPKTFLWASMDIGETASSHPALNNRKDIFPGHRALDQRFRDLWPVEAGHPSETRSLKIYWLTVMQWCRLTILQPHIEDKVSKGELSSCQLGNHMASLQVWETACTRAIRSSVCILWYIIQYR